MRLFELLLEDNPYRKTDLPLSNYRGPYDPRTDNLEPYDNQFKSATDLWDIIDDILENGHEPKIKVVNIGDLLATQDWLSTEPGDGPMWEEYSDLPIVLDYNGQRLILDGHHRISKARKRGQDVIEVYYFSA